MAVFEINRLHGPGRSEHENFEILCLELLTHLQQWLER